MIKYVFVGMRPAADHEGTELRRDGRQIAILKPNGGGRRVSCVVKEADCRSGWDVLAKAICASLGRNGKRVDPDEILLPLARTGDFLSQDSKPLPQIERTRYDAANARLTGTDGLDRTAGLAYRGQPNFTKSNADYLREHGLAGEVHFDADSAEQVRKDLQREAFFGELRQIGLELSEVMAGVPDAPHTLAEHKRLMELTPLGRATLAARARGVRPSDR